MSRVWQPGDVALISPHSHGPTRAIFVRTGEVSDSPAFIAASGDEFNPEAWPDARPLVVIDPEDRDQVKRLVRLATEHPAEVWIDAFQRALHDFANPTPPKPDEPMGLGAVVRLADGRLATRTFQPVEPWSHFRNGLPYLDPYEDIAAVEVLSEGVPA